MPGPQESSDQPADTYDRDQHAVRRLDQPGHSDRPARGSLAELRHRLELMPAGHPSSPYNDDGSRKPPVVRLKDLELALPSDERATGDSTEPDRAPKAGADRDQPQKAEADADRAQTAQVGSDQPQTARADTYQAQTQTDTDLGAPAAAESTGRAADDEPRSLPDGSWEWKGRGLTPEECRIADQTLARCRTAEGRTASGDYRDAGLTPAMRRIEAQLEHARLVPDTEKFALKSPDRFKEKLADLISRSPDKSSHELASEVHDAVRYTYILKEDHYFDGIWNVHDQLEGDGFALEVRRNSWDNPEYKGLNTRWRDYSHDILFEVQFHTPESWEAKQGTHLAYERIADLRTPPDERVRLRANQAEVSATIPVPPRCMEIPDYRKEGQ
jgi:hypothetical protein